MGAHMKIRVAMSLALAAWAGPAWADWYKAESDHFVIYADDGEKDVRRFADMLERYHGALQIATGIKVGKPSPSNRVTVYTVGTASDVQDLSGEGSKYLQGFYIPRAAGSVAFVPDMRSTRGDPDGALTTLLHEYTHHFLISSQSYAVPRWFSEGAAEFYSSATFPSDGKVNLGRANMNRGYELFNASDVSIEELLDDELYAKRKSGRYDAFYGRAWLLYHFLIFSDERKGQLSQYLREFAKGTKPLDAARIAFGDLTVLDRELDKYLRSRRLMMFTVAAEALQPGPITATRLSAPHAAMLPVIVRSRRGVDEQRAKAVLTDARAVAAKFPSDPNVLAGLAEAEYDAGNDAAAIDAADKAIAADPNTTNAYVQKGYALFRLAGGAADADRAYRDAMVPFTKLNAIENDHALPLIYYYRSFRERGKEPTETARRALERAYELAPFDLSLAYELGMLYASEGKIAMATSAFKPIAASPHGGAPASRAREYIEQLAGKPEGTPVNFSPSMELDLRETAAPS
jgi:cytochrome c-type biogenesis protein CcmH/NrfG